MVRHYFAKLRGFNEALRGMTPQQRKCCADIWERVAMDDPVGVPRSCLATGASCPIKGLNAKLPKNLHNNAPTMSLGDIFAAAALSFLLYRTLMKFYKVVKQVVGAARATVVILWQAAVRTVKFGVRRIHILWHLSVRIVTSGARAGVWTIWSTLTTIWLTGVGTVTFGARRILILSQSSVLTVISGARVGAFTTLSTLTIIWLTGVRTVKAFVRTGASTALSAFKTVCLMGVRTVQRVTTTCACAVWSVLTTLWLEDVRAVKRFATTCASAFWSALTTVWMADVTRAESGFVRFTEVFVVSSVLYMQSPGFESTVLDWFTYALGVFGTSIAFLVFRDHEESLGTRTVIRFLGANVVGTAAAVCVRRMSVPDWDNSDMRVLGFGGAAVGIVGVHNLNLFLALSETVVDPFCRLVVAVAMAITTAAALAVHCGHHMLGQGEFDLKVLESGILLYALVSTWPLLLRFTKRVMVYIMRRFRNVSV